MLQCLWLVCGILLILAFWYILDAIIMHSIDTDAPLNHIYEIYFRFGTYIFIFLGNIVLLMGCFFIQKNQFEKYKAYFLSGMKYIEGETSDIMNFHESLSNERLAFINIRKHQLAMEKNYELAYKEKTDLLTYLAHDIKTPLSNLLGYSTLLYDEDTLTREQQEKFIKVIYENVKILNTLSEDFFSYLKFNLNEIPLNIITLNVEVFFKQWEEERTHSMTDNILVIDFINTKDIEIKTDPELLLRVIDNLISNASKYSKKGTSIHMKVMIWNQSLKITIYNEMEYSESVDWKLVKSKFYRGDISRSRMRNNGSGLGLTIVNDIVKHLDGKFEIGMKDHNVCAEIILPLCSFKKKEKCNKF